MPTSRLTRNSTVTEILDVCQEVIGYRFNKPELLRAALTHSSSANTSQDSNERMEFLGDSVLGLVTCSLLYERFPAFQEGDMTKVKSAVVSRKTCYEFSKKLKLGNFLFLGKGIGKGDIPTNIMADVYEALVAAIYLDGGFNVARDWVLKLLEPEVTRITGGGKAEDNAKSLLQHMAQGLYGVIPRYNVLDEQDVGSGKCFKVEVELDGHHYPAVWAMSKKEAELNAAMNALAELNDEPLPFPPSE